MKMRHETTPQGRTQQQRLAAFFCGSGDGGNSVNSSATRTQRGTTNSKKRRRREHGCTLTVVGNSENENNGSRFGICPLCQGSFPSYQLERHASDCTGVVSPSPTTAPTSRNNRTLVAYTASVTPSATPVSADPHISTSIVPTENVTSKASAVNIFTKSLGARIMSSKILAPTSEPLPGLFLYEEFISEEEELQILNELDGKDPSYVADFLPWKASNFNGSHLGKRWGVHCNLRERRVDPDPEHPLPHFVQDIILPKLQHLPPMNGCVPNEANAIDYQRDLNHYLASHVDDRKLSKEPIANISFVGDCYMTFTNVAQNRNTAVSAKRVLLKRRCLQVLTGKARYDFSHGIAHGDLLSDRRVSVTMRASPITNTNAPTKTSNSKGAVSLSQLWGSTSRHSPSGKRK
jgi:alkylated DNA repair dioxygenase AlkB